MGSLQAEYLLLAALLLGGLALLAGSILEAGAQAAHSLSPPCERTPPLPPTDPAPPCPSPTASGPPSGSGALSGPAALLDAPSPLDSVSDAWRAITTWLARFFDARFCQTNADCAPGYACAGRLGCLERPGQKTLVLNGPPSEKVDILFVGDGYASDAELEADALLAADYDGTRGGLFSTPPFNSSRSKFNLHIARPAQPFPADASGRPDRAAVQAFLSRFPAADQQIILSRKAFRSAASFDGDGYISLAGQPRRLWGRLLMHEYGHAFGHLLDEYVEDSKGDRSGPPNCAPDNATARAWWGGTPGSGAFSGCSYGRGSVRPTFNSVMRDHEVERDGYGPVNERALSEALERYR